ncbi:hypothetical protein RSAG8_04351, partial [Rhizoctonia solani AG-8 WAC10335]
PPCRPTAPEATPQQPQRPATEKVHSTSQTRPKEHSTRARTTLQKVMITAHARVGPM